MKRDKHGNPTDCTMTRVRKETLRKMQIVAAFKNITLTDYIDHLMSTQGVRDIHEMADAMSKVK
jgi:hypothetical protein